jgi:hypothetical protein
MNTGIKIKLILNLVYIFLYLWSAHYYEGNIILYTVFFAIYFVIYNQAIISKQPFWMALSVLITLGFPIKLAIFLLSGYVLVEPVGNFSFFSDEFDKILIVSSLGGFSIFLVMLINSRYKTKDKVNTKQEKLKISEVILYITITSILCAFNYKFKIFNIGVESKIIFPYKINFIIFWLYIAAIPLWLCFILNKTSDGKGYEYAIKSGLIIFTVFIVSISTLSRAPYFFVALPLLLYLCYQKITNYKMITIGITVVYIVSFILSINIIQVSRNTIFIPYENVNSLNSEKSASLDFELKHLKMAEIDSLHFENSKEIESKNLDFELNILKEYKNDSPELKHLKMAEIDSLHFENSKEIESKNINTNKNEIFQLAKIFVYRFVGLEGVASVVSYPYKSSELQYFSFVESRNSGSYGLYQIITKSPYTKNNFNLKNKLQTGFSPGIIGFSFYGGNYLISLIIIFILVSLTSFLVFLSNEISNKNYYANIFIGVNFAYLLSQFTIPYSYVFYMVEIIITVMFFRLINTMKNTNIKNLIK